MSSPRPLKKAVKIDMIESGHSLEEKMRALRGVGFDGVELNWPGPYEAGEVLAALDSSGLEVPGIVDSVHWTMRLSDPDPAVRQSGLKALREALFFAKRVGATSVLVVPGAVMEDATFEQCWARSMEQLKLALDTAEEIGVDVLIENVWNDFITDPKTLAEYIDAFDSNRIAAHFDVGNTLRYSPPEQWIPVLGTRIRKLDIKDFCMDQRQFDTKLLEGDIAWPKVMGALDAIGYSGWVAAEVQAGDVDWLADLAKRMDTIFAC